MMFKRKAKPAVKAWALVNGAQVRLWFRSEGEFRGFVYRCSSATEHTGFCWAAGIKWGRVRLRPSSVDAIWKDGGGL